MAQSRRFRQLERRLEQLESLLPDISPTGDYGEDEYDRVRAYRLLVHAEIESCIEELAESVAHKAVSRWVTDGRARRPLLALLAFTEVNWPSAPSALTPSRGELRERIERAKSMFTGSLRRVNGIRERDVLAMLLPVGFREVDFDTTWLATINSFGEERGETAHTTVRVQSPPDPKTEKDRIMQILDGLRDIDEKLLPLGRS